jgi:diguanylate cyclase (GGDEF)-like protein/PAS domain S-box-containing protein
VGTFVTPQRQHSAAEDAQENARALRSILACLNGLFFRSEASSPWCFSFLNEGSEALTGHDPASIGTEGWSKIILPEDLSDAENAVATALAAQERFQIVYRIRQRTGGIRWVEQQGHGIYDAGGRPLFLEGLITDVTAEKKAEELQRAIAAEWRKTLDTIPQMAWSMSADGSDSFYNQRWAEFIGRKVDEVSVRRIDLLHPDDRAQAQALWTYSFKTGEPYEARYRILHHSGTYRWILSRAFAERDGQGRTVRWYGACTDIHEQVLAEQEAASSREFAARLVAAAPDALLLLDGHGRIVFSNGIAEEELTRRPEASVIGRPWRELLPLPVQRAAWSAFRNAPRTGRKVQFTLEHPIVAGRWWDVIVTPIDIGTGRPRLLITARDISHQKEAEQKACWSASHDALTGLPNRSVLQQHLDRMIASSSDAPSFALLLLDVDDFKRTNDTLGHDAGDALLCSLADHLRAVTGADDVVARLGGDEFAVLLPNASSKLELLDFALRLTAAMGQPVFHAGTLVECRASIGGAVFPAHGATRCELLKSADLALYSAKATGGGTMKIFDPSLRAEFHRRTLMLNTGKRAVDQNLVIPFYQPKVELRSGRIVGFEALLRWQEPFGPIRAPDTLYACFDDPVLALELSERIIGQVIGDCAAWRAQGIEIGHVAINAAAAEFRQDDFAHRLLARLAESGVGPEAIQLEVTESVFLGRGAECVERALRTLSAAGMKIALDDFGTGFASLSHLKKYPVDVIKIDRSFVRDLQQDKNDCAILDAVVGLGRSLRKEVVAEGIETEAQHDFLRALGCHVGQGFLYGHPQPAAEVPRLLGADRATRSSAA